mgnify:FL=1
MISKTLSEMISFGRLSGKAYWAADGLLRFAADDALARSWSPENLLADENQPAAQEITPGRLRALTLRMTGAGRVKVTGAFVGVATAAQPLRIFTRDGQPLRLRPIGDVSWFGLFEQLGGSFWSAATNLFTWSQDISQADWIALGATVAAASQAAPDGATMQKLVESAVAETHRIHQNVAFTGGVTYTVSRYVAAGERDQIDIMLAASAFGADVAWRFDLTAVTASQVTAGTNDVGSIEATPIADATATAFAEVRFRLWSAGVLDYAGDGVSGLYLWGGQCEAGDYPSPYIPTAGAAAARAADVTSLPLSAFDFNPVEGTLVVTGRLDVQSTAYRVLVCVNDGTAAFQNRYLEIYAKGATLVAESWSNGAPLAIFSLPFVAGRPFSVALRVKAGDFAACIDGGAVLTGANPGPVTATNITTLSVGRRGPSWPLDGFISRLVYIPFGVSNEMLQALTA